MLWQSPNAVSSFACSCPRFEMRQDPLDLLQDLFRRFGSLAYGEEVTQEQHALQCATAASERGAPPALVAAAFLHDVGHMLHRDAAAALQQGVDDRHEILGARFLARWFGRAVVAPIELHVEAKRYLCATEPDYHRELSTISRRTLELQGGPMSEVEATAFIARPFATDAIRLRRYDDEGKQQGAFTLPADQVWRIVADCVSSGDAAVG